MPVRPRRAPVRLLTIALCLRAYPSIGDISTSDTSLVTGMVQCSILLKASTKITAQGDTSHMTCIGQVLNVLTVIGCDIGRNCVGTVTQLLRLTLLVLMSQSCVLRRIFGCSIIAFMLFAGAISSLLTVGKFRCMRMRKGLKVYLPTRGFSKSLLAIHKLFKVSKFQVHNASNRKMLIKLCGCQSVWPGISQGMKVNFFLFIFWIPRQAFTATLYRRHKEMYVLDSLEGNQPKSDINGTKYPKIEFKYELRGKCNNQISQGNLMALEEVFGAYANIKHDTEVKFRAHCSGHWQKQYTGTWEQIAGSMSTAVSGEVSFLARGGAMFSKMNLCRMANQFSQVTTPCLVLHPGPHLQYRIMRWINSNAREYPVLAWKLQGTTGGSGVRLVRTTEALEWLQEFQTSRTSGILQGYVHNPLTYLGYKVDIRVYLVVTSLDPLWLYVSRSGMYRAAYPGAKYNSSDLIDLSGHITNCHFGSRAKKYIAQATDETLGTLGTLTFFRNAILPANNLTASMVWASIRRKLYTVLLSLQESLLEVNPPKTSFLSWVDIVINERGEPFIMELDPNTIVFKENTSCSGSDVIVSKENYKTVLGGIQILEFEKLWRKLTQVRDESVPFKDLEEKVAQLVGFDVVRIQEGLNVHLPEHK